MPPSTRFIQGLCVVIGVLFLAVPFAMQSEFIITGLLLCSIFFHFASMLGANPSTNFNSGSRRTFKMLALLSSCPLLAVGIYGIGQSALASQWQDLLVIVLRTGIFAVAILGIAFDHHPAIRRLLSRAGFPAPKDDELK